ncbi:MAG: hypothetical protein OHK0029_19110 [Armatimonadaceae bacterium]
MAMNAKRAAVLLALLAVGAAVFSTVQAKPTSSGKNEEWKLVWSDEFNENGRPNPRNWVYETGFVRNQEFQWYQPENARCENGFLIIEGKRERKPNPNYEAGSNDWKKNREFAEYTAASLKTTGLHAWKFGRFEMRAQIDTRPGLWPAFWTLGVDGEWPRNGEVDIMEYYRGNCLPMLPGEPAPAGRHAGIPRPKASSPSPIPIGRRSFMSGGWIGTKRKSSCMWMTNCSTPPT